LSKRKKKKFGICPKCKEEKDLTEHHIYPKKKFRGSQHTILLCRECHDELEKLIPFQKMPKYMYRYILDKFLKGEK